MPELSPQPQYLPDDEPSGGSTDAHGLRSMIQRLSSELANRQADPRPLPSSVMRAYQALIDKYYAQLADLEQSDRG